ncbi:killer cell lectin-like receptor subfamily B member 1B allele A [Eublepharis macularius]|uniref:Killer cell lectin-like receptor subfamily B member 1B allele A n=1 Tax=Eublepharis macularius TaxID=481883 RepID=A0AA97KVE5_EUBMA|nr:killer cell lectin-like receptor subfamily B member 1B allele A [Eublepharis macularius]
MEDEENSMALNFQSIRGQKRHDSRPPVQDMLLKQPRRYRTTARIGCAVMLLLIGAMIVQRIWAFQMRQPMNTTEKDSVSKETAINGTENKSDLEKSASWFQRFFCQPLNIRLKVNSTHKLCPQDWFFYEDKCYWISKEKGSWKKSKEDCTARSSQMLVMQKQKDMVNIGQASFIQCVNEEMQLLWIGLQAMLPEQKWTWVNGSPLDDKQSQELGPVETNSCGMLNGTEIISEACSTVATWVCETDTLNKDNI